MRRSLLLCSLLVTACGAPSHVASSKAQEPIDLHARDAVVHGAMLRYEPEPHKDTLGYWTNVADWAEWPVAIEHAGTFEVHVLQGCGAGQGGSTVRLSLGDASVEFVVEDTGHFQNFKWRQIGTLAVPKPGRYLLQVRPQTLASRAVMDLRQVRLVPRR